LLDVNKGHADGMCVPFFSFLFPLPQNKPSLQMLLENKKQTSKEDVCSLFFIPIFTEQGNKPGLQI
jgi:hypothetical protein